jgi:alpha-mannosidase
VLSLYYDYPNDWDAWDIDATYWNQRLDQARAVPAESPPQTIDDSTIRFTMMIGSTAISQIVRIAPDSKRLDFHTEASWFESHRMLRVAFGVNVRSDLASYDIQYGYVKRPTHRNTSWDWARFESAGQRYADLSQPDYGVALLNDGKYGYSVHDNVLDLNLLRSPTYPDPDADRDIQRFTYALLPHTADLVHSNVMAEAAKLNRELAVFDGYKTDLKSLPWRVEGQGLSLEVVKKAEKEECLILRIVETLGMRSSGRLIVENVKAVLIETNLMEWEEGAVHPCDQPVPITLDPFEIRTYKLK